MPREYICRICGNALKPKERHGFYKDVCTPCYRKTKKEPVKRQKLSRPNQWYRDWYETPPPKPPKWHQDYYEATTPNYHETPTNNEEPPKQEKPISPPVHTPSSEDDSTYTSIPKPRVPEPPPNIYRNAYFDDVPRWLKIVLVVGLVILIMYILPDICKSCDEKCSVYDNYYDYAYCVERCYEAREPRFGY